MQMLRARVHKCIAPHNSLAAPSWRSEPPMLLWNAVCRAAAAAAVAATAAAAARCKYKTPDPTFRGFLPGGRMACVRFQSVCVYVCVYGVYV